MNSRGYNVAGCGARGGERSIDPVHAWRLHANNIPARYGYNSVELNPAQAKSVTNTESVAAAWLAFMGAGFPLGESFQTGVMIEHAYVIAYVPYSNYRGRDLGGSSYQWVKLDPFTLG